MIPPWIRDLDGADPYELLGVDRAATTAEVSQAYLKLIKVVHPDLPTGDEEKAKLIGLARDILLDTAKRADYNRYADTGSVDEPVTMSVWDDDDIAAGVMESPVTFTDETNYSRRHQQSPSKYGLGLGSLAVSLICGPVGLIMAIAALRGRSRSRADHGFAWAGLVLGSIQLIVCCIGAYGVATVIDPSLYRN